VPIVLSASMLMERRSLIPTMDPAHLLLQAEAGLCRVPTRSKQASRGLALKSPTEPVTQEDRALHRVSNAVLFEPI